MEYSLSIIKPDAVKKNITGKVNSYIEQAGLKIVAQRMLHLSRTQAEIFYAIHKERPFFNELVEFMISGPAIAQVLKGTDAIKKYRDIMGATNPKEADAGTIRGDFADNIDANCVHGSDSKENAQNEIAFFFSQIEIMSL